MTKSKVSMTLLLQHPNDIDVTFFGQLCSTEMKADENSHPTHYRYHRL